MSRIITEMTAGEIVHLDETVDGVLAHVPYIYLGVDGSGNARILRQYAAVQKRMHSSNVGVYDGCEADLWLENEEDGFLSRFDAATLAALVSTEIIAPLEWGEDGTQTLGTIARRCFLLSYTNLGYATTPDEGPSFLAALQAATGLTGNSARIGYNESSAAVYWWSRSATSASQFRCVYASGGAYGGNASGTGCWLRPALSVSPETIVSDETEDTIYLLPDESKLYREIDATIYLGGSVKRPKAARLMVQAENCTTLSLAVSNNAKDAEPVWVEVENGGVAKLANTAKETDEWELGVKVYATSGGKATIGEPALVVETEEE